jgi:catalase (peroxidase I)
MISQVKVSLVLVHAALLWTGICSFASLPSHIGPALISKKLSTSLYAGTTVDIAPVREALAELVKEKNCGPILVRLAWHDAGTYSVLDRTGGARGCMRFEGEGEANFGANAGLDIARGLVQPIKDSVAKDMSYADFWALASIVGIKEMGGPDVKFRVGRKDAASVAESVPEGRHPDGDKESDHLREVFYRMGLSDKDIVVLSGAHTVGMCHADRSGFDGAWTEQPLKFDNSYFVDMLNKKWEPETTAKGCPQFKNESGESKTIMLISDLAMIKDDKMRILVEKYAADEKLFFDDFAVSYQKLTELGAKDLQEV